MVQDVNSCECSCDLTVECPVGMMHDPTTCWCEEESKFDANSGDRIDPVDTPVDDAAFAPVVDAADTPANDGSDTPVDDAANTPANDGSDTPVDDAANTPANDGSSDMAL